MTYEVTDKRSLSMFETFSKLSDTDVWAHSTKIIKDMTIREDWEDSVASADANLLQATSILVGLLSERVRRLETAMHAPLGDAWDKPRSCE